MPNIQPISELRNYSGHLELAAGGSRYFQLLKELHTEGDEYDEP